MHASADSKNWELGGQGFLSVRGMCQTGHSIVTSFMRSTECPSPCRCMVMHLAMDSATASQGVAAYSASVSEDDGGIVLCKRWHGHVGQNAGWIGHCGQLVRHSPSGVHIPTFHLCPHVRLRMFASSVTMQLTSRFTSVIALCNTHCRQKHSPFAMSKCLKFPAAVALKLSSSFPNKEASLLILAKTISTALHRREAVI